MCPAGDPPGVGTSYCRLCGRDYVEVPDPVEALAAEPVAEPVAEPLLPEPVVAEPAPVLPVLELVPAQPTAAEVQDTVLHAVPDVAAPGASPGTPEPAAPSLVERRLVPLAAAAGFVGGLVVGGAAVSQLL